MAKTIRNTLFTLVVLSLTAVGINWSRQTNQRQTQLAVGRAALAGLTISAGDLLRDFPLEVSLKPVIDLGQNQTIAIRTQPFADLEILIIAADGQPNSNISQKAVADELGLSTYTFKSSDFHQLGIFQVLVTADLGSSRSQEQDQFIVQTGSEVGQSSSAFGYQFPIIP